MTCPKCGGCLGRQWCLDTRTEYDYCLNCGKVPNQTFYQAHVDLREDEPRRCLECGKPHKEVWETREGVRKLYTRCYKCRRKASFTKRRTKAAA